MRIVCLRILAFGALLLLGGGAQAGAWLEPPGQGQAIVGGTFSDPIRAYDVRGRLAPVSYYRKFELTAYAEYGVTDWLTAIAAPSALSFRGSPPGQSYAGIGVLEAGGRVRLIEVAGLFFSAQATVRSATNGASRLFLDTGRGVQGDIRVLIGKQFEVLGLPAFASIEIGYRSPGGFGHEARADLTLGVRATAKILLLAQTFNITAVNVSPLYLTRSSKVALSAVYSFTDSLSVQLGGIIGLPGVNMASERGIIGALWYRF